MGLRLWLTIAALASSGAGAAGCQSSAFACQSDGACPEGRCEPQGWCSFPDPACASGSRFADHAAEGLAGTCVDVVAGETEIGTSTGAITTATELPDASSTMTPEGSGTTSTTEPVDADATSASTSNAGSSTTTTGPGSAVTVTVPIAADADDGAMYATPEGELIWAQSGEDGVGNGFFGEYPEGEYYVAYFRFALPEQADTGLLFDAHLSLRATPQVTYEWTDAHAAGIWIELRTDAPQVSGPEAFPQQLGGAPPTGVTLLESSVRWPASGPLTWAPGTNISPDLTPLFDALTDQAGALSAGDHIQLWLAVSAPIGTGGEVTYVDYASRMPFPAELELAFYEP